MAKGSPEPMPGSVPFEGMENLAPIRFNVDQRRAFGSVPRLLGVHLELPLQLTAADREHAQAEYLKISLYSDHGQAVNGLALNPEEFTTILINAETFEKRLGARAERAHRYSNPVRRQEAKINSPLHAYADEKGLRDKHEAAINGLQQEVASLAELRKYVRAPGFAMTTEGRIRELATIAWEGSFKNLLRVAGNQRAWTERDRFGAAQAVAESLFTGPQRSRVGYWQEMTELAGRYASQRRVLFTQRLSVINTRINLLNKQKESLYAEHGFDQVT